MITAVLGGSLYLDANLTIPGGEVLYARTLVHASTRNSLTEDEKWLDRYFDSIQERNSTWWESDLDNDNLSNFEEKVYGTHPLRDDTDGDQLTDDLEITYQTNPHQPDTDADGLTDYNETVGDPFAVNGSTGTDPRKFDTDKDGMSDGFEVIYGSEISELDPTIQNTLGKNLGGYVFNLDEYVGQLYIKVKKVNEGDPVRWKRSSIFHGRRWMPQHFLISTLLKTYQPGICTKSRYSLIPIREGPQMEVMIKASHLPAGREH